MNKLILPSIIVNRICRRVLLATALALACGWVCSTPAKGGTLVTLTGSGFTGAFEVDVGNTPVFDFTVNYDTQLSFLTPAGPNFTERAAETPYALAA